MSRYTGKPGHQFSIAAPRAGCSCGQWEGDASDTQTADQARRQLEADHRVHVGEAAGVQ